MGLIKERLQEDQRLHYSFDGKPYNTHISHHVTYNLDVTNRYCIAPNFRGTQLLWFSWIGQEPQKLSPATFSRLEINVNPQFKALNCINCFREMFKKYQFTKIIIVRLKNLLLYNILSCHLQSGDHSHILYTIMSSFATYGIVMRYG